MNLGGGGGDTIQPVRDGVPVSCEKPFRAQLWSAWVALCPVGTDPSAIPHKLALMSGPVSVSSSDAPETRRPTEMKAWANTGQGEDSRGAGQHAPSAGSGGICASWCCQQAWGPGLPGLWPDSGAPQCIWESRTQKLASLWFLSQGKLISASEMGRNLG